MQPNRPPRTASHLRQLCEGVQSRAHATAGGTSRSGDRRHHRWRGRAVLRWLL